MNESEILSNLLVIVDSDQWINLSLLGCLAIMIGCGIVLLASLFKIFCDLEYNGVFYFLLQLSIADAFSLFLCFLDVIASSSEWKFGNDMCSIFILFSNLALSATIYFVLIINLHCISTANLALQITHVVQSQEEKNEFLSEEFDSASGTYDTLDHKRTLTIDYSSRSKWKTSVNVFVPNVIVWLISFFVTMPSFIFSITMKDSKLCIPKKISIEVMSIVGLSEIFMILIKSIVPVSLIALTLLIAVRKIRKVKNIDETLVDENPKRILSFAIYIASIFLIFQAPKICLDAILFLGEFKFRFVKIAMCMIFYFGITVRLALSRILIKKLREF